MDAGTEMAPEGRRSRRWFAWGCALVVLPPLLAILATPPLVRWDQRTMWERGQPLPSPVLSEDPLPVDEEASAELALLFEGRRTGGAIYHRVDFDPTDPVDVLPALVRHEAELERFIALSGAARLRMPDVGPDGWLPNVYPLGDLLLWHSGLRLRQPEPDCVGAIDDWLAVWRFTRLLARGEHHRMWREARMMEISALSHLEPHRALLATHCPADAERVRRAIGSAPHPGPAAGRALRQVREELWAQLEHYEHLPRSRQWELVRSHPFPEPGPQATPNPNTWPLDVAATRRRIERRLEECAQELQRDTCSEEWVHLAPHDSDREWIGLIDNPLGRQIAGRVEASCTELCGAQRRLVEGREEFLAGLEPGD